MIRLEVEDYCQQCLDFTPDVTKPERTRDNDGGFAYTDTIIHCKYRKRCGGIARYLEQRVKGDANV